MSPMDVADLLLARLQTQTQKENERHTHRQIPSADDDGLHSRTCRTTSAAQSAPHASIENRRGKDSPSKYRLIRSQSRRRVRHFLRDTQTAGRGVQVGRRAVQYLLHLSRLLRTKCLSPFPVA